MAHVEPTAAQLETAWQFRRREDWPPTFEQVMAHPTYSRIVRMFACHEALMQTVHQRAPVIAPDPPPLITRGPHVPRHAPIFDRKRLAAGEREDD